VKGRAAGRAHLAGPVGGRPGSRDRAEGDRVMAATELLVDGPGQFAGMFGIQPARTVGPHVGFSRWLHCLWSRITRGRATTRGGSHAAFSEQASFRAEAERIDRPR
jgi:hypothetical protein